MPKVVVYSMIDPELAMYLELIQLIEMGAIIEDEGEHFWCVGIELKKKNGFIKALEKFKEI